MSRYDQSFREEAVRLANFLNPPEWISTTVYFNYRKILVNFKSKDRFKVPVDRLFVSLKFSVKKTKRFRWLLE